MKHLSRANFQRNQGAVLFVALIMLLLLTLLGITAMQVTMLQERMSGNFRAQQVAFERAEGRMAEGRDHVSDPLYAYDNIPNDPVQLTSTNGTPWQSWLSTYPPAIEFEQQVRFCGGACGQKQGSASANDPNKDIRFYIISGQEKDPGSAVDAASWATVQTIYVF